MTLIASPDATFTQDKEPNLAIPFKAKSSNPLQLDPSSVPPGFDMSLADLLWKVKLANIPLTGKIAEYAGFYLHDTDTLWDATTDNKNEPDKPQLPVATANKQRNKSLDKLTYLIMFILPHKTSSPGTHFGDPLTGPHTTWTYLGNQLRVSPLKKLNIRGEQVNSSNKHCDDDGADLGDEYDTLEAFKYYGFDSAVPGELGTVVKTKPLYAYLTLSTEGAFGEDETEVRSVTQMAENILGLTKHGSPKPVFKSRLVRSGVYLGTGPSFPFVPHFPADPEDYRGQIIQREANANRHYVVNKNNVNDKLYLELVPLGEDLSDEVFELKGLKVTPAGVSNTSWFVAEYYPTAATKGQNGKDWRENNFNFDNGLSGVKRDLQFEKIALEWSSSVTTGWGLDMGRWWPAHYYNINFKILIYNSHAAQTPAATDFRLLYRGTRVSNPISFNVSAGDAPAVVAALLELLELTNKAWNNSNGNPTNPDTITVTPVTNSGDPNYSTGCAVTIRRINMMSPVNGFYNIYLGNVFYDAGHPGEVVPNVKITPPAEKDRFVVNTHALNSSGEHKAWKAFTDMMNAFFGGTNWLDPAHFTGLTPGQESQEIARFEELMKRSIGVKNGPAFVFMRNNWTLLRKFRLPKLSLLYPPFVEHFVIPEYYNKIYANVPSHLKQRMNVAEKYVLLSRAYQGKVSSQPEINKAIESKNIDDLIAAVKKYNADETRETKIIKNLKERLRKHVYRNVEY